MSAIIGYSIVVENLSELSGYLEQNRSSFANQSYNCLQFGLSPEKLTFSSVRLDRNLIQTIKGYGIHLIYHGKYVYNFARSNIENQMAILEREISIASSLNCPLIIHQGKNVKSENLTKIQAINNYVAHLSEVINRTSIDGSLILLENSTGQGTEMGYTLNELSYIYHQFDESVQPKIGFCLDTCHLFASGEVDFRRIDCVCEFFARFDHLIGTDKIKCFHFNDSSVPFGSKIDRHGDLMGGYITNPLLGGHNDGLEYVAQFAYNQHIPIMFETPFLLRSQIPNQMDYQYHLVDDWMTKRPLTKMFQKTSQIISQLSFDYYRNK